MDDSFTIELWRYVLEDHSGNTRTASKPSRWSRQWSNPSENLTQVYKHVLKTAEEWQHRDGAYGSRVELIAEGERLVLIDFRPRGQPFDPSPQMVVP